MDNQEASREDVRRAFEGFWIRNNSAFLLRYWHTAGEAVSDPNSFTEFKGSGSPEHYIDSVVQGHLEHHNYSGVLLTYAVFDEFMVSMTAQLGRTRDAPIPPNDLRDRGVKRYKKFVHKVCRVSEDDVNIDWQFLEDFAVVRNAIIHANGNKSLLRNRDELEAVVRRHDPALSFKHTSKLVISDDFVLACMKACRDAALVVNELSRLESEA